MSHPVRRFSSCSAIVLAAPLVLSGMVAAQAECVELRMMSLESHQSGAKQTKTNFKYNEKLVICVKADMNGYVSLWDAPPDGDFERLMPSVFSKDAVKDLAVEIQTGKEICVGTPDTYPLYIPEDEGRGAGKVSAIVTQKLDDQPQEDDYLIPGRSLAKSKMRGLGIELAIGSKCKPKMNGYISYTVD